ncbi:MAG: helix-turn-helix protein [Verrucomicrobiota bacterium]
MSQFSSQLTTSSEEAGLTQTAIREKTEISQGTLSRYFSGDYLPPLDQLEKLLSVFPAQQQRALVLAFLEDNVPGKFRGQVVISHAGTRSKEEPPVYRSRMPRELREAYDGLGRKALEHTEVADSLIATWRIIGPRDEKK